MTGSNDKENWHKDSNIALDSFGYNNTDSMTCCGVYECALLAETSTFFPKNTRKSGLILIGMSYIASTRGTVTLT